MIKKVYLVVWDYSLMRLIKMLITMKTGGFLDYYDDDEKNLPEPCEREWRTREKVDCVHGVSEKIIVQPLRMCSHKLNCIHGLNT